MAARISDLIEKLEQLKETYGDPILLYDDGSYFDNLKDFDISNVTLVYVSPDTHRFVSFVYSGCESEVPVESILGLILHTEPTIGRDFED